MTTKEYHRRLDHITGAIQALWIMGPMSATDMKTDLMARLDEFVEWSRTRPPKEVHGDKPSDTDSKS